MRRGPPWLPGVGAILGYRRDWLPPDIDTTAADTLTEILDEFDRRGIRLAFAELKGPVRVR